MERSVAKRVRPIRTARTRYPTQQRACQRGGRLAMVALRTGTRSSARGSPVTTFDAEYQLEHRYTREAGRVFLTGVQALVRLPLEQRRRDLARGWNTAG